MKTLSNVTLIGVDCVDLDRLQLAADISTKNISFGSVKLLSSIESDDTRVIKIPNINSVKKYSDFMIKELHKYVDTEFALIFQYDGFVLNSSQWDDLFLKYDYIGAPWYHLGNLRVGNGGFSLRSKKLLDWLGENWIKIDAKINPEDVFISKFARKDLEKEGMKFATEDVAKQFSKEGNERSVVWNGEFGFHGIKYTDISRWLSKNPEQKKQLTYKLGDYATIMKKYPTYTGNVHTFRFKKGNIKNYKKILSGEKKYEARITKERYYDLNCVKEGDIIILKKSEEKSKGSLVFAFEKEVKKIEVFNSLKDLRTLHPKIHISLPTKEMSKIKVFFAKILGDSVYPKNSVYSLFWFD